MSSIISKMGLDDSLIVKPDVIPVVLKRLNSLDGIYVINKGLKVGDTVLIRMSTKRRQIIEYRDGRKHEIVVVNRVTETGRDLGWICCECFYL